MSFPHRLAIELIAANEATEVGRDRDERRAWLHQRDYRVVDMREVDVMSDLEAVLVMLDKHLAREAS